MTLSKHVNAEALESRILLKYPKTMLNNREQYISKYSSNILVPKYAIPEDSSDGELVYRYINEELTLDGSPTLNLASFVNTNIDEIPKKLINENIVKNLADNDEYPSLIDFQERCVTILSHLWHAPTAKDPETGLEYTHTVGTATTGSSEAILLAGLAMKKRWQARRKAEGKPAGEPNILMASCAQVALEKFARYFDVENRTIRITEASHHLIDTTEIKKNVDENTIGIFVILGSTFTGAFEPVEQVSHILDEIQKETGLDVPIHVDGALGGMVAPFVYPHLKWDFELPRVVSINTSGHKFGLTTSGLGWIVWRDIEYLPESLRFKLDYLGGVEETFTLNFSRPGFPVLHQYYNFLSLGREGYTKIFDSCIQNARLLSNFLEQSGYYEVLSVIHHTVGDARKKEVYTKEYHPEHTHGDKAIYNEAYEPGLPVVAFRLSKEVREQYPEIPQSIISTLLRNKGFIVPNYHLTPDEQEKEILRVVVRDTLSLNLLEKLMADIIESTELLIRSVSKVRDIVKHKATHTAQENHELVYELLLSIASNGMADVKEEQHKKLDVEGTGHRKHKKSYRGAC